MRRRHVLRPLPQSHRLIPNRAHPVFANTHLKPRIPTSDRRIHRPPPPRVAAEWLLAVVAALVGLALVFGVVRNLPVFAFLAAPSFVPGL